MMDADLVAEVRHVVLSIPPGRVASYGDVGRAVGIGPRQAGRAVALLDDDVPWWRVVHAGGVPPTCHAGTARGLLEAEGVPFRSARVDMTRAWSRPRPASGG